MNANGTICMHCDLSPTDLFIINKKAAVPVVYIIIRQQLPKLLLLLVQVIIFGKAIILVSVLYIMVLQLSHCTRNPLNHDLQD